MGKTRMSEAMVASIEGPKARAQVLAALKAERPAIRYDATGPICPGCGQSCTGWYLGSPSCTRCQRGSA